MLILMNGSMPMVHAYRDRVPFGLLLTPLGGLGVATAFATDLAIAVDNGAFTGLDPVRFRRLLGRIPDPPRCLFVACPDVVGDAEATLRLFDAWEPEIHGSGFRVALVGQDGLESISSARRQRYWDRCDAFFVGGTDAFKLPPDLRGSGATDLESIVPAIPLIREAKTRGKWIHFGRVNSAGRINYCERIGCDSVDGSGLVRTSKDKFPRVNRYFKRLNRHPLFGEGS
jgi:hypothetical protein